MHVVLTREDVERLYQEDLRLAEASRKARLRALAVLDVDQEGFEGQRGPTSADRSRSRRGEAAPDTAASPRTSEGLSVPARVRKTLTQFDDEAKFTISDLEPLLALHGGKLDRATIRIALARMPKHVRIIRKGRHDRPATYQKLPAFGHDLPAGEVGDL